MTTTNKLFKWEDVQQMLEDKKLNNPWKQWETIHKNLLLDELIVDLCELPTYPEPIKWSNHALLQEYIDWEDEQTSWYTIEILQEIQSRLTEWTEYEDDKEYEFSVDGEKWYKWKLSGYTMYTSVDSSYYKYIRPISPISPELTSAISVLEANWYTVCKK